VKTDCKVFNFLNGKCSASLLMKRNPRETRWTYLYRRTHKKIASDDAAKRRTRRAVKFQRAIQGATLDQIMAKRNQKPEVRQAQREQQIQQAKLQAKAQQTAKKQANVKKNAGPALAPKVTKAQAPKAQKTGKMLR
jgi:large subunit ribosomal protein L24e